MWRPPPARRKPARPQSAEPSWAQVFATTVGLWLERHTRRGHRDHRDTPRDARKRNWRWIRLASLVVVVVLAAVAGVALARYSSKHPGSKPRVGASANPVLTAQGVRNQAAAWIVAQVSRSAIVSCDPVMCSALQSRGFPASNLDVLGPNSPDPLDSSLVAATDVLRSQFGTRLASVYAPVVMASFGTGSAGIQIRVVAPDGAPVYQSQLRADIAARKSFGSQLLHNRNVTAGATAAHQLQQGQVDARLISVIGTMAGSHPLRIVSFGDAAAGAAAGVPLRSAIIAADTSGSSGTTVLGSLRSFLEAQQPPYLPAVTQIVRLGAGQTALEIQFAAPDPLGLLDVGHAAVGIPSS
jgi:hypothetical protein